MPDFNVSEPVASLEGLGRVIVERLGGEWQRSGGMCRCPAHDDRTPSLSVRPGERRLLFHCFAGCRSGEREGPSASVRKVSANGCITG